LEDVVGADGRVRWALVGTSEFALDWIAPAIQASPTATLTAVVSRSPTRARAAADRLDVLLSATALAELDREQVDAVHIVTPNTLHAPLAIEAAERGFHVVVEKPMATSTGEARAMMAAAERSGVTLHVGHCMAWAPPVETAVALIGHGRIGRPLLARFAASFDSPPAGTWRQDETTERGGGPLLDLGAHSVDALLRMMGPASAVVGRLDRTKYAYAAEDTASLLIRLASGAHAVVQTTFTCAENEFVVVGEDGRLSSTDWLGREFAGNLSVRGTDAGISRFDADKEVAGEQALDLVPTNVYRPMVDEVSGSILDGTPSRISGARGFETLALLEAGVRSARSGSWVAIEALDQ
jgi:predicted dehydrogenase